MKRKRKLVTYDEATPAKSQHKRACSDCPWSRDSVRGWLGALSVDEWLAAAHGEATVDCHVHSGVQCAGLAIYRANNFKLPRNPEALRLEADRERVFSNRIEFREHHESWEE